MSKKKYHIAKGVTHVNGQKLKPNASTIELNEAEALFDLSMGRISEKPFQQSQAAPKAAAPAKPEDKEKGE